MNDPKPRHSRVSRRLWTDEGFRSLSVPPPNGQTLWLRLLTGPELTNIPGIIPAWEAGMAQALRWPLDGFREAFAEVSSQGMAEADWDMGLVWVPKAILYNRPQSINVIKSWLPVWDITPECDLKVKAYHVLKAYVEGMGEGFRLAFEEACSIPSVKPKPIQDQDQDQEQKQDQEKYTEPECEAGAEAEAGSGFRLKTPTQGMLAKRGRRPTPKTVIPDDWKPSERCLEILAGEGIPGGVACAIVPDFIDYWRSEQGFKADWDATFRGRVRFMRAKNRLPSPTESKAQHEETFIEVRKDGRHRVTQVDGIVVRDDLEANDG